MCKALRSRIACAVGVAEDLNDAYKNLDGVIGRASYQHSIEDIRQHVLAIFGPLITVALDFLSPFISQDAQPAELHYPREHLRQILRIRANGITYDSGLTQFEALLSTDNKLAASLLNRDLLMALEVI
ncbi:uncharacterized protein SCHCODRAFT_02484961 [Schizophyllum commune H4-8]|uniref:Expressed protein n=1 Tax=Schizophyllum commune (strain H4-8 / FGSC 9210) TaxID=578458 RepID=D8PX34_SCHCM|nr:uncharacterized protein SCHCODRAFT_02484961 [Schizophyllum commune H4-8]KAI5899706.1 hypothetical protein SCHCODRAFT_02484961 [Schizophyllum commune H4-8]